MNVHRVRDVFKVIPGDPGFGIADPLSLSIDEYPVPAQPRQKVADWFWKVRQWTASDNYIVSGAPTFTLRTGIFENLGVYPLYPDLVLDEFAPGPGELSDELDIWKHRANFHYEDNAGTGGGGICHLWLCTRKSDAAETSPGVIIGNTITPQCYIDYTNSPAGFRAQTGNRTNPPTYDVTFMLDGIAVPGLIEQATFVSDPGIIITLTPSEYWSHDGTYDTATGVQLLDPHRFG